MSILSNADGSADDFFPNQTPGSITLDDERDPFGADNGRIFNSASKFPLHSSSSVRNDLGSSRSGANSNPFASPVAARPPLRSTLDVFSGGRGTIDRLDQYSAQSESNSTNAADKAALSPILTLGLYKPAMDRIVSVRVQWTCFLPQQCSSPSALFLFLLLISPGSCMELLGCGVWLLPQCRGP